MIYLMNKTINIIEKRILTFLFMINLTLQYEMSYVIIL